MNSVVDLSLGDVFGQAKVSNLYQEVIFHQDVAGSQISMHIAL